MPFAATWMDLSSVQFSHSVVSNSWMDLESAILSELREGEISYDISYMLNLKRNYIHDLTKQKETHRLRK